MTTIERTAYPRFDGFISPQQLEERYLPTVEERAFAEGNIVGPGLQFNLILQLKAFQHLHHFIPLQSIPDRVIEYVRSAMNFPANLTVGYAHRRTLYRHRDAIRQYCGVKPYQSETVDDLIEDILARSARTMNDPADLINAAIEELLRKGYELPAFSKLDRLASRQRERIHAQLFEQITLRLSSAHRANLDGLLEKESHTQLSEWIVLKKPTGAASVSHMRQMQKRLERLLAILPAERILKDLLPNKIIHFAAEARALDTYRMSEIRQHHPVRYYALMACFIHEAQVRARDDLVTMFLKRMAAIHAKAKEEMEEIHKRQRIEVEHLADTFSRILHRAEDVEDDGQFGKQVRNLIDNAGGVEKLRDTCDDITALRGNNHLPLLYRHYRPYRSLLFGLVKLLQPRSSSSDQSLVQAIVFMQDHRRQTRSHWQGDLNLNFASRRWRRLMIDEREGLPAFNRHVLETCIFSYVAQELRSGDLYVPGSRDYADPREQLLTWKACKPLVDDYCARLGFQSHAKGFVDDLRQALTDYAQKVDRDYVENGQLYINVQGTFSLKRIPGRPLPPGTASLEEAIHRRMPQRSLLDVLRNIHHWTRFTRHWGPVSGREAHLDEPLLNYIMTAFAYGTNLGPTQTAMHTQDPISSRMLSYINYQHVTAEKLDAAMRELINFFGHFSLPQFWGTGKVAAADGTQLPMYDNNLIAEYHHRYQGWGGIAYHFVADMYIALFTEFITCGVWEGVYILDLFYQNESTIQPDTIHADTQGQSTAIFALAYLLGIHLFPRIRNWQDLILYRPDPLKTYEHIDALFGDPVDWTLIETHWQDLLQVALSIQERKVLPSTLLRKLNHYSRKNRLFKAFQELGRVIRTLYLLRYISDMPMRRQVTEATNKAESFHRFSSWLRFGAQGVITHNAPEEHEKRVKYTDLLANALMLQNVIDMTRIINELRQEGYSVTSEILSRLSPYLTHHIRRFGVYHLDVDQIPEEPSFRVSLTETVD